MSAVIQTLIPEADNASTIRDQIAAILVLEEAEQRVLAAAAAKDPELWRFRTFVERANPIADFLDEPDLLTVNGSPIVNITLDQVVFDGGNTVKKQEPKATYHIDCIGYGKSGDDGAGYARADRLAAYAAQRAVKNVWGILMSSYYAFLGLRGVVGKRHVKSVQYLQPDIGERAHTRIVAGRIIFEVDYIETSPQYPGVTLELLTGQVKWADTGEVLVDAHYDYS